jgi:hypothetical protein
MDGVRQATCDGVVAIAHTEGGQAKDTEDKPNNFEKVPLAFADGISSHLRCVSSLAMTGAARFGRLCRPS